MNEISLKNYPKFHFISFEDQNTNLEIFRKCLLKRMNGDLFQIKVVDKYLMTDPFKFLSQKEALEKNLIDKKT